MIASIKIEVRAALDGVEIVATPKAHTQTYAPLERQYANLNECKADLSAVVDLMFERQLT